MTRAAKLTCCGSLPDMAPMIGKLNVGPKATIAPITWRNRKIAIQMVIDALSMRRGHGGRALERSIVRETTARAAIPPSPPRASGPRRNRRERIRRDAWRRVERPAPVQPGDQRHELREGSRSFEH